MYVDNTLSWEIHIEQITHILSAACKQWDQSSLSSHSEHWRLFPLAVFILL